MSKDSNKKENVNEEKVTKKSDSSKTTKKSGFKDFKAELKKVVWPTPKELLNSTTAVIVIVIVTAIIVFFLDVIFESLNTYGIDKLRTVVSNSVQKDENKNGTNNQEEMLPENTNETGNTVNNGNTTTNQTTNQTQTPGESTNENTVNETTETGVENN
ncbi:MAG: preprotein translocase subunit SecE [Clostridia bacterium]|nr:preprotein translocase subunit SecE [Clostridia bacterium]